MSAYELAQLNIALMKEPIDSPVMAEFVANLDRINALAEHSPADAFPPPDAPVPRPSFSFGNECPAT
jgi:hypothetical protein